MATAFRLLPNGIEEAQFKRVPEGWLFTTANPWVFAPRRTYLVNDAQEPAIAARVRQGRYIRLALLVPVVLLLAAAFIRFPFLLHARSLESWLAMGAFVVAVLAAITISDYLNVRPLLRDIPRTAQKIRSSGIWRRQSETMSVKALSVLALLSVFAAVGQALQALSSEHERVFSTIGAVVFAMVAINYGGMLVAKLCAKRDDGKP